MSVYNSATLLNLKHTLQALNDLMPTLTNAQELLQAQSDYKRTLNTLYQLTDTLGSIPFDDEALLHLDQPKLNVPPRVFTSYELATYYNGTNGLPAYIAVNSYVFDVTHCQVFHHAPHHHIPLGCDVSHLYNRYHSGDINELAQFAPILGRLIK